MPFVEALIGSIVSKATDAAVDNLFGGGTRREAGHAMPAPILPSMSDAPSGNSVLDLVGNAVENEFSQGRQRVDAFELGGFIQDPLLAKLAAGEEIKPIDFLGE